MNDKVLWIKPQQRTCGECTKCCEGWLFGEAHGKNFYKGRKCHFLEDSCTIYDQRPINPCKSYSCMWLIDLEIPSWLKPSLSNIIISKRKIENIEYLEVIETGIKIDSSVLNWLVQYSILQNVNILYFVDGGVNRIGQQDFLKATL